MLPGKAIDEHIFLADIGHPLPEFPVLLEQLLFFIGHSGENLGTHLFRAVQTADVDHLGSPDRITAARADMFLSGTGLGDQ